MEDFKIGEVLMIKWEDTSSEESMLEANIAKKLTPYLSYIVGFLLEENENCYVICMESLIPSNNGRPFIVRNTSSIPKRSVVEIKRLNFND